ncbi:hypothetical protein CL673_06165 [Candidatus Bathyarchaeota archaeon]|nr:hypothetical protein [Candidatus Bathyarchaeota archaeon]
MYYYFLKTMVLDSLYIRCYALKRFFEAVRPSSIIFISPQTQEMPLDFTLQYQYYDYGKSYYSQVIPIVCKEKNIPLTSVHLETGGKAGKKPKSGRPFRDLLIWYGNKILPIDMLRRTYFNYQYLSRRPFPKSKNRDGLNVFMLKLTHIGMDFVTRAVRKGYNVYQLSGNSILKYSSLSAMRCLDLKTEYKDTVAKVENNSIWENTASLLESHDLIKLLNQRYRLDVSEIVLPKLKYFIAKVCPEILGYFKVFIKFYKEQDVDFAITPHEVSPIEFAALAAANYEERVRTVRISHGDDAHSVKFWRILELSQADILVSSNTEAKEYFNSLRQAGNLPTTLYSSRHRLSDMERISRLRETNKSNIKKNKIVYLPTLMMWDTRRMDGASYPDTWYYQFQKSLAEYFYTKRGYIFVLKGLPPSEAIYNPIPDFIRDNSFGNIEVATNPFSQHLFSADRVICDYPSTGFYESIAAGVPTICLYHRALIVRKSAIDYFGNLLKPFSDATEAVKHIDEFLNSAPELYTMTLDVEDNGILDILEEAGRRVN